MRIWSVVGPRDLVAVEKFIPKMSILHNPKIPYFRIFLWLYKFSLSILSSGEKCKFWRFFASEKKKKIDLNDQF